MKLSESEEILMNHLWELKTAFMKELIQAYDDPKPAPTTIATLLKRMQQKGFIDYVKEGSARKYSPLIKKSDYAGKSINKLVKNFFGDSSTQFASFFTKNASFTKDQLEELRSMIDSEIKKKK